MLLYDVLIKTWSQDQALSTLIEILGFIIDTILCLQLPLVFESSADHPIEKFDVTDASVMEPLIKNPAKAELFCKELQIALNESKVAIRVMLDPSDGIHFTPGAPSKWQAHSGGFLLISPA